MTYYVVKTSVAGMTLYQTETGNPSPFEGVAVGCSTRLKDARRFDEYLGALEMCGRGDVVAMVEDGTVTDMEFRLEGVRVMLVPTIPDGIVEETFKENGGVRFLKRSFRESEWLEMKSHKDASECYRRHVAEWAKHEGIRSYRLHRIETSSREVFDRLRKQKEGKYVEIFRMSEEDIAASGILRCLTPPKRKKS